MVKYILKCKLIDTCIDETETERKLGHKYGVKCMKNGVIYYTGSLREDDRLLEVEEQLLETTKNRMLEVKKELEDGALERDTLIIEEDFAKIVLVDFGSFGSKEFEVKQYIEAIVDHEQEQETIEDKQRTRLIFLIKDRDYWPGSEKDSDAMTRRAMKEMQVGDHYGMKPDHHEVFVPCLPREDGPRDITRETFRRYFDPSLPGTGFIVENMDMILSLLSGLHGTSRFSGYMVK